MEPLQFFCLRCAAPVEILPEFSKLTQDRGVLCLVCIAADERKEMLEGAKDLLAAKWERLCPALFQDTDESKLPCVAASAKALEWKYGPKGLNLWGPPATGKSRTMYLILKREHLARHSIKVFGPGEFACQIESRAYRTGPWLASVARLDLLAFDDLGKESLTTHGEKLLFGLIDRRVREKKPVIYTMNTNGNQLVCKFRLGESLTRRVREFSTHVHFPKPT